MGTKNPTSSPTKLPTSPPVDPTSPPVETTAQPTTNIFIPLHVGYFNNGTTDGFKPDKRLFEDKGIGGTGALRLAKKQKINSPWITIKDYSTDKVDFSFRAMALQSSDS